MAQTIVLAGSYQVLTKYCAATRTVSFQYPEVCHNHYFHRNIVKNTNSHRILPKEVEEQFNTIRSVIESSKFMLVIAEVNCNFMYS